MGRPARASDYPITDEAVEAVVNALADIEYDDGVTIPEIRAQVLLHRSSPHLWRMDEARGAIWVRHVMADLERLGCVVRVDTEGKPDQIRWQTG